MARRRDSYPAHIYVLTGSLIVVIIGVALSPLGMTWLGNQSINWALLSDVGQAYGGASALLSGLAFCGIAVSLLLQWRQFRSSLLYSVKQRHFELVKLALENPEFLYVDGDDVARDPDVRLKVYGNLLVNHWAMTWDMGFTTEPSLRQSGRRLFLSALARDWWTNWGNSYLGAAGRRRFVQILDEEASAAGRDDSVVTAVSASAPPIRERDTTLIALTAGMVAVGVVGATAVASLVRRYVRPAPRRVAACGRPGRWACGSGATTSR
jgi:hypothetical protein